MTFERPIMDLIYSVEVQRLRGVQQLSLTSYQAHGATHTRFGHCVGTAYLVRLALDRLMSDEFWNPLIGNEGRQETIAAGLLHDIGHGPLGHVMDLVFQRRGADFPKKAHEARTFEIITDERSHVRQVLDSHGIVPEFVAKRALGMYVQNDSRHFLSEMVAGYGLDFDRIAYLAEDMYHVGLGALLFNYQILVSSVTVVKGENVDESVGLDHGARPELIQEGTYHLAFRREILGHSIEPRLMDRLAMYHNVYHGEVNNAAQLMVVKALEALTHGGIRDEAAIMGMTDDQLWGVLEDKSEDFGRVLVARVRNSRLYRPKLVLRYSHSGEKEIIDALAKVQAEGRIPDLEAQLTEAVAKVATPPDVYAKLLIGVPQHVEFDAPLLVVDVDGRGRPLQGAKATSAWRESIVLAQLELFSRQRRLARVYGPPEWEIDGEKLLGSLTDLLRTFGALPG